MCDQQVATLATSDIETDGLSERLSGLEIEHVKLFPGWPIDDVGGDESSSMAEMMLFRGKSFPIDSTGAYVECPEGIARDNGSAFLDREQVFEATGQLTGPGVLTVLDVQCDQSLATGAGEQESRVIVGEAAEGARAGGRIE